VTEIFDHQLVILHALNQMFLKATQEVIPKKKSKKKKKPKLQIMSEKILTAIKGKKEAFHLWKTNGRPKNSDNTYTINKKNTTNSRNFMSNFS
jgi:hypothetical protein